METSIEFKESPTVATENIGTGGMGEMVTLGTEEHGGSGTHTLSRTSLDDVATVITAALVGILGRRRGHVSVSALVYLGLQGTPNTLAVV